MLGSPTITVKGRNLLAKIVADNIPLTLSNIGLGDGLQEENEEVTILANEIMKKEIESCKYSEKEGQYYIRRVFTNADLEEGFYIREVGIYAIDPDEGEILYAYTNAGENGVDYFAPGKGKVIVKEIIEMATKFGNAENITVVIDPSIALVSENEFEEYKNSNKVNTDNLQKQVTKNTTDLNEKANNWLKGKTINVLGDSITAEATGSVTWVTRVSEKLGCTCNNYAIGGRAFTGDNGFWNMVDSMDVNADVNIIMGGVNDYLGGAGLGIKGGNTELTNYYVYDGLEKFAKAMTTKFSKSINIIITPLKAETRSATTYNQYEIVKALYYIADKYNFILIDLYSNAPNYNPNITELKTRFTKDGIHPTQEYVDKYLAPVIVQNLLSINNSGNVAMIEHDFCMAKQSNAETIASGTAELELVLYNNSNQTNNNLMVATNGVKTYEHGIYIININSALYGANASGEVKFSLYINGSMFLQHTLDFNGSANEHKNISVSYSYTLPKNAILTTKVTNNTNASINVFETSLNVIKI